MVWQNAAGFDTPRMLLLFGGKERSDWTEKVRRLYVG
jgi:hypothetical protein